MRVVVAQPQPGHRLVQPLRDSRQIHRAPLRRRVPAVVVVPQRAVVHRRDPRHRTAVLANSRKRARVQPAPRAPKVPVREPLRGLDHAVLRAGEDGGAQEGGVL